MLLYLFLCSGSTIFLRKDTSQGIHLALYWLQHPSLRSHIFFSCHGDAGERKEWIKSLVLRIISSYNNRKASREHSFREQWMRWSNMNETTFFSINLYLLHLNDFSFFSYKPLTTENTDFLTEAGFWDISSPAPNKRDVPLQAHLTVIFQPKI